MNLSKQRLKSLSQLSDEGKAKLNAIKEPIIYRTLQNDGLNDF